MKGFFNRTLYMYINWLREMNKVLFLVKFCEAYLKQLAIADSTCSVCLLCLFLISYTVRIQRMLVYDANSRITFV